MEQKEKTIGTTTYLVTQLDAVAALKIQTKLIKIIGPGIFSLVGKNGKNTAEKVSEMIPALMENFDDEIINSLVLSLFERNVFIKKNGDPVVLDFATHFAGKPMEMWKVVGFILEANFNLGMPKKSDLPTTEKGQLNKEN